MPNDTVCLWALLDDGCVVADKRVSNYSNSQNVGTLEVVKSNWSSFGLYKFSCENHREWSSGSAFDLILYSNHKFCMLILVVIKIL